jgi:hypothetical protein
MKMLNGSIMAYDTTEEVIDQISGGDEGFIQNFRGMEACAKRERPTSTT